MKVLHSLLRILLDLLRMNVAPLAVFQMLRSMCAGQRLISTEAPPDAARGQWCPRLLRGMY